MSDMHEDYLPTELPKRLSIAIQRMQSLIGLLDLDEFGDHVLCYGTHDVNSDNVRAYAQILMELLSKLFKNKDEIPELQFKSNLVVKADACI